MRELNSTSPSNDASRQKEAEKHSPEASPSNSAERLRAHHMIASGQNPREWQAGTAEASTSGLDGQSARLEGSDNEQLHRQADSHYARHEYEQAEPLYEAVLKAYEQEFGRRSFQDSGGSAQSGRCLQKTEEV